jgi:heme/copper-type cytochrome/quinol oxidase subunit 3
MSELAAHGTDYQVVEEEPPELLGRNLASASHLLASATAFFLLAFLFAYFYLRSLNEAHMWRPKHTDPSLTLGTIVTALILLAAVAVHLGLADHRAARRPQWRLKGAVALTAGLAAIVLQIVQWLTIGFGPSSGGYASVFLGWTAAQLFCVLGAVYWLETVLATAIRYRKIPHDDAPAGHASGDPHRSGHDIANPLSLVRPGLEALAFYWWFLAGAAIVAWIVLYLI